MSEIRAMVRQARDSWKHASPKGQRDASLAKALRYRSVALSCGLAFFRYVGIAFIAFLCFSGMVRAQSGLNEWEFETTIGGFEIHSDFQVPDKRVLEITLERLECDARELLKLPAVVQPVHIVLFGSESEYNRYMQHYFPSISLRRAIYLQDRGPGMLFTSWHKDLVTDLRHESIHALLNQFGSQIPLWLDEGLAEYFEIDRDNRFGNSPYIDEVSTRAKQGLVPSLMEIEKVTELKDFTDEHYRDSWAWIHLLLHRRPQTRELLIGFLHRSRTKTSQLPLSRQLFQIMDDPSLEFQHHFANLKTLSTEQ